MVEEVKLESLQEEILDMIVNLSMTGHNRTIIYTYDALSHTSTKFKRLVSNSPQWINAWINVLFTGVAT